jgi:hypothetical protein
MILFTILVLMLILLLIVVIGGVSVLGSLGIIVFGDVIVCIGFIALIIWLLFFRKK